MNQDDLIKQTQSKFTNPWIAGIFLTYIAYRGKVGMIGRVLMGATGVAMIYKNYQTVVSKKPDATLEDHLTAYKEGITQKEEV